MKKILALLVILVACWVGCGRGRGGGGGAQVLPYIDTATGQPVTGSSSSGSTTGTAGSSSTGGTTGQPGLVTPQPTVPNAAAPPVGLTWEVAFVNNVSLATMQTLYNLFVQLNARLWQITEGQVYVARVNIRDNANPGLLQSQVTSAGWNAPNTDWVIFPAPPDPQWNTTVLGLVRFSTAAPLGRNLRVVCVPVNAVLDTLTHEAGHFVFNLNWPPYYQSVAGLDDEYKFDRSPAAGASGTGDDVACIMELTDPPFRLCAAGNHIDPQFDNLGNQGQPRSCWAQILLDYTAFGHAGTDMTGIPTPTTTVSYNDTP